MTRTAKILHLAGLTAASVLLILLSGMANARSSSCGPRDAVVQPLAEGYGETRQSIGPDTNNVMIEGLASAKTGSWTISNMRATGVFCLVALGRSSKTLAGNLRAKGNEA